MSRCGKTEQLESLAMGELSGPRATELELHASHCAVCHHELNWLKSERLMFEHRVAREQVERLWEGFSARKAAPARHRAWGTWAMAIAATGLLMIGLGSTRGHTPQTSAVHSDDPMMSFEEMSLEQARYCSTLQPGTGFACGPYLPASFVAQR